jgi:hypothetical protein
VQVRLPGFDRAALGTLGRRARDLYLGGSAEPGRVLSAADDNYVDDLAAAVTGSLGGKVGVAPRIFLKKLVADVLDRIDQFPDFNPRSHYALTMSAAEMSEEERNAAARPAAADRAADIDLDLP